MQFKTKVFLILLLIVHCSSGHAMKLLRYQERITHLRDALPLNLPRGVKTAHQKTLDCRPIADKTYCASPDTLADYLAGSTTFNHRTEYRRLTLMSNDQGHQMIVLAGKRIFAVTLERNAHIDNDSNVIHVATTQASETQSSDNWLHYGASTVRGISNNQHVSIEIDRSMPTRHPDQMHLDLNSGIMKHTWNHNRGTPLQMNRFNSDLQSLEIPIELHFSQQSLQAFQSFVVNRASRYLFDYSFLKQYHAQIETLSRISRTVIEADQRNRTLLKTLRDHYNKQLQFLNEQTQQLDDSRVDLNLQLDEKKNLTRILFSFLQSHPRPSPTVRLKKLITQAQDLRRDPLAVKRYRFNHNKKMHLVDALHNSVKQEDWHQASTVFETLLYSHTISKKELVKMTQGRIDENGLLGTPVNLQAYGTTLFSNRTFFVSDKNAFGQILRRQSNRFNLYWNDRNGLSSLNALEQLMTLTGAYLNKRAEYLYTHKHYEQATDALYFAQSLLDWQHYPTESSLKRLEKTIHTSPYLLGLMRQLHTSLRRFGSESDSAKDFCIAILADAPARLLLAANFKTNGLLYAISRYVQFGPLASNQASHLEKQIDNALYDEVIIRLGQEHIDDLQSELEGIPDAFKPTLANEESIDFFMRAILQRRNLSVVDTLKNGYGKAFITALREVRQHQLLVLKQPQLIHESETMLASNSGLKKQSIALTKLFQKLFKQKLGKELVSAPIKVAIRKIAFDARKTIPLAVSAKLKSIFRTSLSGVDVYQKIAQLNAAFQTHNDGSMRIDTRKLPALGHQWMRRLIESNQAILIAMDHEIRMLLKNGTSASTIATNPSKRRAYQWIRNEWLRASFVQASARQLRDRIHRLPLVPSHLGGITLFETYFDAQALMTINARYKRRLVMLLSAVQNLK